MFDVLCGTSLGQRYSVAKLGEHVRLERRQAPTNATARTLTVRRRIR